MANPPLSGIKVLDLTKLAPGPFCTMILADCGAEVIKIEEPGPPTGRRAAQAGSAGIQGPGAGFSGSPFNALNRNKKSIGINLKSGAGKEVYHRLAQRTDVIVEEYRPGVAKRLGIDYETLAGRSGCSIGAGKDVGARAAGAQFRAQLLDRFYLALEFGGDRHEPFGGGEVRVAAADRGQPEFERRILRA